MFDLHIFSRFLRLLRSIRRSLLAFFVAIAMLLATFVIAPAYALSAGESAGASVDGKTNTAQTEGAKADGAGGAKASGVKADGAKADGAQKQGVQQSEPNKTESDKKNTDTSSTLNKDNKESKPDSKQQPDNNKADNKADNEAGNKADNNAKSDDKTKSSDKTGKTVEKSAANKNGKDAKNKAAGSAKAANGTERSTKGEPQLPKECKGKYNTFAKCYSITYGNNTINIKGKNGEPYYKVPQIITPTIKVAGIVQQTLPNGVWLGLEKYGKTDDSVKYAFFKGENDKNDSYTAKSTQGVSKSDGSIRFFASKWMAAKTYKFKFVIHYPDGSKSKPKSISEKLDEKDLPKVKPGDLSLSLYDFENAQAGAAIKDNKIIINPKPKGSDSSGSDTGGTGKKDVYDPINKLFIESQSKDKPGFIYHRMICHETGRDDNASYTVDKVNGLSLSDKDGSTTEKQTWFKHVENNKPTSGADKYSVYLNDDTERSQSWISGTPTKSGTFECKVFAIKKDDEFKLKRKEKSGKIDVYSTVLGEFDTRVETNKQSLFDKPEQNIVEDKWTNKADIKQGVDWAYKTVTIQFGDEPPKPTIGDNDLTLKVYPFKDSTTALTSSNNKISAMLGMELKPFIDATSAADSKNKITLRMLCKGEKKNAAGGSGASTGGAGSTGSGGASTGGTGSNGSGSAVSGSSSDTSGTGSNAANTGASPQPTQPSESSQSSETTWSSNLAELGLSVPADDKQNTCHSNKEGEKTCVSADPSKKVAARTDTEMSIKPSIKPTAVGDYQCVVFALKPDALTKFDTLTGDATQSGSLTPESIKSELTKASPASFKEHKDFATFAFNLHLVSNFTLPNTGGQSWNLQLGILAALLVNLLAAGFVVSQSERGRKLILGRWRGLCNYV